MSCGIDISQRTHGVPSLEAATPVSPRQFFLVVLLEMQLGFPSRHATQQTYITLKILAKAALFTLGTSNSLAMVHEAQCLLVFFRKSMMNSLEDHPTHCQQPSPTISFNLSK